MSHTIHTGDSAETLKQYPDNHFDSIVTDPPYGIEFLGKDWDTNTGAIEIWRECLRVLKPGGHLLAFSAARTYHHLATNIESQGFEIRDQLMWIYASGFPKAQDVGKGIHKRQQQERSYTIPGEEIARLTRIKGDLYQHPDGYQVRKLPNTKGTGARDQYGGGQWRDTYERVAEFDNQWRGWKTALKPAHEPIVMARKPFKGSTIDNVLEHGVGALNIDASRISYQDNDKERLEKWSNKWSSGKSKTEGFAVYGNNIHEVNEQGRYPSNVMGEIPDYQKYFYCPKVSRRERHCGFEQDQIPDPLENYSQGDVKNHPLWDPSIGTNLQRLKHKILEHNRDLGPKDPLAHIQTGDNFGDGLATGTDIMAKAKGTPGNKNNRKDPLAHIPTNPEGMYDVDGTGQQYNSNKYKAVGNNHPTVKPVALMRYLIQLVTPPNGRVLDPFLGSGSTGMAACELGHDFVGSEQNADYVAIANSRIQGWLKQNSNPDFDRLFDDTSD